MWTCPYEAVDHFLKCVNFILFRIRDDLHYVRSLDRARLLTKLTCPNTVMFLNDQRLRSCQFLQFSRQNLLPYRQVNTQHLLTYFKPRSWHRSRWLLGFFSSLRTCVLSLGRGQTNKLGKCGQADRLGWPPPIKRSGKCEKFWLWFSTLVFDYIWLKTNFTQKRIFWPQTPPYPPPCG